MAEDGDIIIEFRQIEYVMAKKRRLETKAC